MPKQRLVVIGNGMAGARAVEEILARGGAERFEIAMFGDEPYGNYNRILLSNVVNGSQDATDIFLNSMAWYEDHDIRLHAGVRATQIDRIGKRVYGRPVDRSTGAAGAGSAGAGAGDEVVEPYDKLIIATGSRPFIPPIKNIFAGSGKLRPGVFAFRTLDDCRAIMSAAAGARRAVVIGGGLLGLEAARGLLTPGCEVHIVHLAPLLMNQQLDREAGGILRGAIEKMGITAHLGQSTAAILGDDEVTGVLFKDDTTVDCDMVVVSTGIQANGTLALESGLSVERGIVVDNHMRSVDDFDVYVVGECAQHRGVTYGLVAPLWDQAKVLAEHITERNLGAVYTGSKLATKLKVMGIEPRRGPRRRRGGGVLRAQARALQEARHSQRTAHRGHHARRSGQGRLPHPGLRQEHPAARGAALAAVRPRRAGQEGDPRRDAGRGPDLQLQRRLEGRHRRLRRERQANRQAGHGEDPGRHGMRIVQVAGLRPGGLVLRRPGRGGSERPLLRPQHPVAEEGAGGGHRGPGPPLGLGGHRRARGRPRGPDEQAGPRLLAGRGVAGRPDRGARRPLHQRSRPRQHPEGRDLLGGAGDRGRDLQLRRAAPDRGRGGQVPGPAHQADRGPAHRSGRRPQGRSAGGLARPRDAGRLRLGQELSHLHGSHIRKGDLLCVVETHDEVLRLAGRFMQYYRENAKYKERTYTFVERVGIERVRAVVVDDADGLAGALDQAMEDSVARARDPWLERDAPATPNQFQSLLPSAE
jgi:NADPH-dependent 2,4-dienoyl-CoA reductase/sulfur reductase-like enzyme